jgi:RecB family exonuclease
MQRAIAECALGADPLTTRSCAVLVPSRGAAAALRASLENLRLGVGSRHSEKGEGGPEDRDLTPGAVVVPDLVTRDELYRRWHRAIPDVPPLLTGFDREVIFRRAALSASAADAAPFRLRPGLIREMLAFYDELRRRDRTVDDFERLMTGSLEASAAIDRGAERMLVQTRFLTAAFREFERRISESGGVDEHGIRARLLERETSAPYSRIVVTVGDRAADPVGLWTADFDLLARLPGITHLDVIATEQLLATGFHERVHDLLPGLIEERRRPSVPPVLLAPEAEDNAVLWFVSRDREEELANFARAVKESPRLDRTGVVFQRPLPYLYLARHVFPDAGVPYQALDALPLAGEPIAAAIDLLFSVAAAEATRASLIDLLGSPHWRFDVEGEKVERTDVAALDELLRSTKYLGGWERIAKLGDELEAAQVQSGREGRKWNRAARGIRAAVSIARDIRHAVTRPTASGQLTALLEVITAHEQLPDDSAAWYGRHMRARAAILSALQGLAAAHAVHGDEPLTVPELMGGVRRWVEGQTFSPRTGTEGITLLDARAAAYADLDNIHLVGLVESDWPDRARRNIFYPSSLLTQLGWPNEHDRLQAARARFRDLLRLPRARVSLSSFTLEEDAIVASSPFLEELPGCGLAIERRPGAEVVRVFAQEALSMEPVVASAVIGDAAEWLRLRESRTPISDEAFHGAAGPREPSVYAVSHVERYLECPFKYFASYVLELDEERDVESGLTPQERGQFLHEVFEAFFKTWHARGGREITASNVEAALTLFDEVAHDRLSPLSEADRALERTHLLGSAAAAGLAARAFAFEIEHQVEVVERLLEHPLEGEFVFRGEDGSRRLRIRAKADRIDLLSDGTLRLVDYKLGRAPRPARALQLPVYGVCATQALEGRHGRSWTLSRAGYVAFKEKNAFSGLGTSAALEQALADGQQRFLGAVAGIERGSFPVDPEEPFLCTRCGYAGVCRKDYVGDE